MSLTQASLLTQQIWTLRWGRHLSLEQGWCSPYCTTWNKAKGKATHDDLCMCIPFYHTMVTLRSIWLIDWDSVIAEKWLPPKAPLWQVFHGNAVAPGAWVAAGYNRWPVIIDVECLQIYFLSRWFLADASGERHTSTHGSSDCVTWPSQAAGSDSIHGHVFKHGGRGDQCFLLVVPWSWVDCISIGLAVDSEPMFQTWENLAT